jgi:hypothetical protein
MAAKQLFAERPTQVSIQAVRVSDLRPAPPHHVASNWRKRLTLARNILALAALAAAYLLRSGVWWRRWQRRHPASRAGGVTNDVGAPPPSGARRGKR